MCNAETGFCFYLTYPRPFRTPKPDSILHTALLVPETFTFDVRVHFGSIVLRSNIAKVTIFMKNSTVVFSEKMNVYARPFFI
jgi:hypothetical protein